MNGTRGDPRRWRRSYVPARLRGADAPRAARRLRVQAQLATARADRGGSSEAPRAPQLGHDDR
jgi:hypothetical protein